MFTRPGALLPNLVEAWRKESQRRPNLPPFSVGVAATRLETLPAHIRSLVAVINLDEILLGCTVYTEYDKKMMSTWYSLN